MTSKCVVMCTAMVMVLGMTVSAGAETFVQMLSTGDTTLNVYSPDTNAGDATTMWFKAGNNYLVKTDMPDIPNYGKGVEVLDAKVWLYAGWRGTGPDYGTIDATVYPMTQDWVESEATWNQAKAGVPWAGGPGGWGPLPMALLAQESKTAAAWYWNGWVITDVVQMWLDGTLPNNGLLFECTAHADGGIKFSTKENTNNPGQEPKIAIKWQFKPTEIVQASVRDVVNEPEFHDVDLERIGSGPGDVKYATWLKFDIPAMAGHTIVEARLDFGPYGSYNGSYEPSIIAASDSNDSWTTRDYADTPDGPAITIEGSNDDGNNQDRRVSKDVTAFLQQAGEGLGQTLTIKLYRGTEGGTRGAVISDPANFTTLSIVTEAPLTTCQDVLDLGHSLTGDLNNDCYVEWADFGIFANNWQTCIMPGDANCDEPWN